MSRPRWAPATDVNAPRSDGSPAIDAIAVMRSKAYVSALLLAAALGVPVSALAYGFLALVTAVQELVFQDLPARMFDAGAPAWWPVAAWLSAPGWSSEAAPPLWSESVRE